MAAAPARPTALIAGIGEGLGVALAARFAAAGYDIVGLARSDRAAAGAAAATTAAGGSYRHLAVDLADGDRVAELLEPIAPGVEVLVHTAHTLLVRPFAETTAADFEAIWRSSFLSAGTVAGAVAPRMVERGRGAILFTGATASLRAGARFAAFASAKFALRGLAQSLARELGPAGVHVAHVVIDGLLDEPQTDARFGAASALRLDPAAVAEAYLMLVRQPPSAWTQELDLRPSSERF